MTKVLQRKPGPKSSKQSQILSKRGTLGETSCDSNSDDSSAEQTVDEGCETTARTPENKGKKRSQENNADASEFCTPELEKDATDYGLEFTTSHIQHPSPRRCSTMRTAESSNNFTKGNDTPTSSLTNKPPAKSKPLKKDAQQKPTKSKTVAKTKDSAAAQESALAKQPVKNRRKQRNPLQLEKRFWKEVKLLQNRTDNLIPMLPFSRVIREIMYDTSIHVTKITPTAIEALQTSTELYLTQRLQDAYMLTLHRGRVTLDVRDMQLINFLKISL